ncbi:MAG TPA: hypothetical protein VGD58_23450 [Herpetosiphonaceae bacterium]
MRKFLILGFLLILLGGCGMTWPYIQAFRTTGAAAVQAMTPQERAYMEQRLKNIPRSATRSQVEKLIGTPYRNQSSDRPNWYGPTEDSRVDVYFAEGKAFKIRWIYVGRFVWERDLTR